MILQAIDLRVRYAAQGPLALDGVSCGIAPGELVAVVGPNGSGKTTLLRGMVGLAPLESGEVRLEDRPLAAWHRGDFARRIGVVSQREEMLYPLRVSEAVMLGRYASLGPLASIGEADRRQVESALRRCDLWDFRFRRVSELSGGEWQRVRVARALAQAPAALLLDEPTTALDIRHEMEVFELIHQLVGEGLGAMVITHHMNLAARYATRMLVLSAGKTVAEGTPREVFQREVMEPVFQWPLGVVRWLDAAPQLIPLRPGEEVRG
ncbi:MAG: ABC transporter ATP-binding protein [Gemmatimonadota bacterium]